MGKPGEERSFIHRVGGKIPRLRGARRESDPGALPIDRFRDVINGRFVGPDLTSRGGQSKAIASALEGCVSGIFPAEYQDADELGLLVISGRVGSVGSPESVYAWDGSTLTILDNTRVGRIKAWFADAGGLYCSTGAVGVDATPLELRRLVVGVDGQLAVTVEASFAGSGGHTLGGIARLAGDLYVAASRGGIGTSVSEALRVVSGAFVVDTTIAVGGNPGLVCPLFVDATSTRLVFISYAKSLEIRDTAGVWNNKLISEVHDALMNPNSWILDPFPNTNDALFGTVVTASGEVAPFEVQSIDTIPVVVADGHVITGSHSQPLPMALFNGDIYYAYRTTAGPNAVKLGRVVNGTWNDNIFTFTGTEPVTALIVFKGRLYALRGNTLESTADGTSWTTHVTQADSFTLGVVA